MLKTRRPPGRGSRSLRLADRYLGVPLVLVVGSLRRKAKTVPQFSSVGLMATAAIGDTILLAGIVSDLRDRFPEKKLVLFTGGSNHEVALLFKGLDEVVRLPTHDPLEAVRMLREKRLDVLVDFGPWPRINALYSLLSGARFTLGFRTSGQYRHYGYDRFVEHSAKLHEIENHRNLMRALGIGSKSLPCIDVDVPLVSGVQPKTYIVFHAWSSGYKSHLREWPEEYWVELAARVVGSLGFDIVLTGAPCDLARTQELRLKIGPRSKGNVVSLAGKLSLSETARVLRDAVAVVSVNTGIMHLAAAVGSAVVAINGPTSALRWGPLGDRAVSVNTDLPGCGYLNLGFEYENQREDCMALITPGRVFSSLRGLIEKLRGEGQVTASDLEFSSSQAQRLNAREAPSRPIGHQKA